MRILPQGLQRLQQTAAEIEKAMVSILVYLEEIGLAPLLPSYRTLAPEVLQFGEEPKSNISQIRRRKASPEEVLERKAAKKTSQKNRKKEEKMANETPAEKKRFLLDNGLF